jgi:O-antigen/teichoic acid export membrane protein
VDVTRVQEHPEAAASDIALDPLTDRPTERIRTHAARGTVVNAAFLAGLNLLGLLKGLVVAVFVDVDEYGVWGIVLVAVIALYTLGQVGFTDKYIQQDEPDQEAAFQRTFTLQAMVAAAYAGLIFLAMPLFALAYGTWELLLPAYALALTAPGLALQTPLWTFQRRMNFLKQRTLQAFDPAVSFVATVALAAAGLGYWALVIGAVLGSWGASIAAVRASPYRFSLRLDRETLPEYFGFSWPLFVQSVSAVLSAQVPLLVAQRTLGLAAVGAMSLASTIAVYAKRVNDVVMHALYPAVCAVKDRTELLLEAFTKSNRMSLLWGFPFGVGMALFAGDLVHFVIGENWRVAVPLIQAFALTAAMNQIAYNWQIFYLARGETRPIAVQSAITAAAVLAIAVPLLVVHELKGFAVGMCIAIAISVGVRTFFVLRLFPAFSVVAHSLRAIGPTAPAAAAVLFLRVLDHGATGALMAAVQVAVYVGVAAVATLALERSLVREFFGYLKGRPVATVASH